MALIWRTALPVLAAAAVRPALRHRAVALLMAALVVNGAVAVVLADTTTARQAVLVVMARTASSLSLTMPSYTPALQQLSVTLLSAKRFHHTRCR